MTSAKQWSDNSAGIEPGYPAHVRVIRDIQMEAFKAGMTRAVEIAERESLRKQYITNAIGTLGPLEPSATHVAMEIKIARDNLKPEDMK